MKRKTKKFSGGLGKIIKLIILALALYGLLNALLALGLI